MNVPYIPNNNKFNSNTLNQNNMFDSFNNVPYLAYNHINTNNNYYNNPGNNNYNQEPFVFKDNLINVGKNQSNNNLRINQFRFYNNKESVHNLEANFKSSINFSNSQNNLKSKFSFQPAFTGGEKYNRSYLDFESLSDKDIGLNCKSIIQDQAGCRFLQKKIDHNANFANDVLFPNVYIIYLLIFADKRCIY